VSKDERHRGPTPYPKVSYKRVPRVYNSERGDGPLTARYCGRGTRFGNPFVIGGWWPAKQRRMTRDDVCDRFECEVLPKLDVSELKGADLECHCAPLRCHCDSIIRKANPNYEERLKEAQERRKEKANHKAEAEKRKREYVLNWAKINRRARRGDEA
jgi:hypothetical protein